MTKPQGIIKLHGRNYKTVALRVQEFRNAHSIEDGWGLCTRLISVDDQRVVFRASVVDPTGKEIAVGFAEERRSPRGINAVSAVENCETSAIGRALAAAGFAGTEYASADELVTALNQQRQLSVKPLPAPPPPKCLPRSSHHQSWDQDSKRFLLNLKRRELSYEEVASFCEKQRWGRPSEWSSEDRSRFLDDLDARAFTELHDPEAGKRLTPSPVNQTTLDEVA